MWTNIVAAVTRTPARLALAAAAALAGPAVAQAHHGLQLDLIVPVVVDPCPPPAVVVEPRAQQVWVDPVYRTVADRQWVGPTYQTVTAHVWVEPVTAAADRSVRVPDQYGWRTVTVCDRWGRLFRTRQWVLVSPAHFEDRPASVVVTPGHYEDVTQQQLVADGHWADVTRQELVSPGQWETRVDEVAVPVGPPAGRLPF